MNVSIISYYYDDRVDSVYSFFSKQECNCSVFVSNFDHISKTYKNKKNKEYTYVHSLKYKKNISIKRLYTLNKWSKDVYNIIRKRDCDIIYIIGPPNSLIKRFSKITKVKKICDIMDLWPESLIKSKVYKFCLFAPLILWKNKRDCYLKKFDKILLECEYYKKYINGDEIDKKIDVVHLSQNHPIQRQRLTPVKNKDLNFLYLGSINHLIDIDKIIEILKDINGKINVHIIGDGINKNKFIDSLEDSGFNVIYYGKVYDWNKKTDVMNNCDFGINIYKSDAEIGLTIKSIDYLAGGLPLLSNIKGDTSRFINIFKIGIDVSSISKEVLNETILNEKNNNIMRNNALECFSNYFSKEAFDTKLASSLENFIGNNIKYDR